jgi:hypothetical protein
MSTNLKSGESEEVVITKVVPNYTFFLHKFFGNFSHPLAIFPRRIQFLVFKFEWRLNRSGPTCQWLSLPPGPACWSQPGLSRATYRSVAGAERL